MRRLRRVLASSILVVLDVGTSLFGSLHQSPTPGEPAHGESVVSIAAERLGRSLAPVFGLARAVVRLGGPELRVRGEVLRRSDGTVTFHPSPWWRDRGAVAQTLDGDR